MEAEIAENDVGEQVKKVQERHEHFAAASVAEGYVNIKCCKDPRTEGAKDGKAQATRQTNFYQEMNMKRWMVRRYLTLGVPSEQDKIQETYLTTRRT